MNNINQERNFLMRYGMSITFIILIIMIIFISKVIPIDQDIDIHIAKINTNSYLGIIESPIDCKDIINQDYITLNIENKPILFRVDSISKYFNISYLSTKNETEFSNIFNAKLKRNNKTIWDNIFVNNRNK